MKRLIALLLLLPLSASSQTIQSGGGTGVGSSFSGGPVNCVLFNKGSVIGCDAGFTYAGGANGLFVTTDGNGILLRNINNQFISFGSASGAATVLMATTTGAMTGSAFNGSNSNVALQDGNNRFIGGSGATMAFTPSNIGANPDTAISRGVTAGVLAIGTGAAGNAAGGMQTGNATLTSLTTGTNADFLCLSAGGAVLIQSTACTISSLRFKPDWKPYQDDAAAKIAKLDVGTFHLQAGTNADPNAESLQAGLSAESVAQFAPECAIYENDMKTPKSYRQECVIALLVKAIQQLKK